MTTPLTIDDVLAALAGGPIDEVALFEGLGVDPDDDQAWDEVGGLLDDPRLVTLADGRVAHGRVLTDAIVAWHRVTAEEARTRTIELDHDALLLALALADPLTATVGDDRVELRMPTDEAGSLDPERGPLLDLPDGWSPDLAADDLVGYGEHDDHLLLVPGPAAAPQVVVRHPDVVDRLRQALEGVATTHRQPLLLAGVADQDEAPAGAWVLHLDEVGSVLLADHADAVRGLDRPLAEVADAAGLPVVEGTVLGPDATEADLGLYALGRSVILDAFPAEELEPGLAEAAGIAWLSLSGEADAHVLDADAVVFLDDPLVAEALARRVWDIDDAEAATVLTRARALAGREPTAPGPGFVLAEALVRTGAPVEAAELLARLVIGPPAPDEVGWGALHEAHGQMCAYAGEVAAAQAAFRRSGDDAVAEALQRWRPVPPVGVGRNDRCPCGSGRKAKQCCLLRPPVPGLAARVPFLWWKLERACFQSRRRHLPWSGSSSPLVATAAVDAHLVEDGALEEVAVGIAPLLPADERELVATWGGAARGLHLVEEVSAAGVVVRDLVTDALAVVAPDPDGDGDATVGDLWLAVLVPGPSEQVHAVGAVIHPSPAARGLLVEALGAGLDGQQVIDIVSVLLD